VTPYLSSSYRPFLSTDWTNFHWAVSTNKEVSLFNPC